VRFLARNSPGGSVGEGGESEGQPFSDPERRNLPTGSSALSVVSPRAEALIASPGVPRGHALATAASAEAAPAGGPALPVVPGVCAAGRALPDPLVRWA